MMWRPTKVWNDKSEIGDGFDTYILCNTLVISRCAHRRSNGEDGSLLWHSYSENLTKSCALNEERLLQTTYASRA